VAQAADWHDATGDDLERHGYAFGSAYLPAVSVGRDHARFRFYFVGHAHSQGEPVCALDDEVARMQRAGGVTRSLLLPDGIPSRMASMRGFGNAIDPEVAAAFIASAHEAISTR